MAVRMKFTRAESAHEATPLPFYDDNEINDLVVLWVQTKATSTRKGYFGIWKKWCAFLKVPLTNATTLHAAAYLAQRSRQKGHKPRDINNTGELAGATLHNDWSVLHRLYAMLIEEGAPVRMNPFTHAQVPLGETENEKRSTECVEFEKVPELLKAPSRYTKDGIRDRAMLALFFAGGMRASEVHELRVGDIQRTPNGILYAVLRKTKAKKVRHQVFADWASEAILALYEQRLGEGAGQVDLLLVRYAKMSGAIEPFCRKTLSNWYQRHCDAVGLPRTITPHSARATAITKLLTDDVPHKEVQEFSGHSSIVMVERYDKRRPAEKEKSPSRKLSY